MRGSVMPDWQWRGADIWPKWCSNLTEPAIRLP